MATTKDTPNAGGGKPPASRKSGKIAEDWKKARRRVLCSPCASHQIHFRDYRKRPTGEGDGYVWEQYGQTVELSSSRFEAEAIHDPGDTPNTVEYQAKVLVGYHRGRPLYGCAFVVDEDTAAEFYPYPEEDKPPPFERFVQLIESQRLYGRQYAFVDDEKAMDGIANRFSDWNKSRQWDEEDLSQVLSQGADTQVGPPVFEQMSPQDWGEEG